MVEYEKDMKLQLWVRDTGLFEGFAVFVDGSIVTTVGDQKTHKFDIPRPESDEAVAVNFGGQDGGRSAIINVADPDQLMTLETQVGVNHGYVIKPV
jgi:hypothetical protein